MKNRQKPAKALFGMLKHRRLKRPVSLKEMKETIRERREKKGVDFADLIVVIKPKSTK